MSKPGENSFDVGKLVTWYGMNFLITDIDENQQIQTKGTMQLCNNILKFYYNNILYEIPCIVESSVTLNIDETNYITEPDDKITVTVSYDEITKNISRNQIFKLMDNDNYKVISVNKVVKNKLIVLKMEWCAEEQKIPSYSIRILNGNELNIQEESVLQLNIQVFVDDILLSPTPLFICESSDETICTVDNNGLITTNSIGNCIITVKLTFDQSIQQIININVVEESNNYTVDIFGESSIIKDFTREYRCEFKNNGLLISRESVYWLTGIDDQPTTLVTIVSQDSVNNICVIRGDYLGQVKLWVKDKDEEIISQDGILIQIKNLF